MPKSVVPNLLLSMGTMTRRGRAMTACLIWVSATSTTVMPSTVSPLVPMNAMSTLNRRCVGFEFVHEGGGRARAALAIALAADRRGRSADVIR